MTRFWLSKLATAALIFAKVIPSSSASKSTTWDSAYIRPQAIASTAGNVVNAASLLDQGSKSAVMNGAGAEIILDYGHSVGGFPTLWTEGVEGDDVQLVVTYSEGSAGILMPEGDGYLDYSNGYSNNRTVTHTLSTFYGNYKIQDYYLQGNQRWQRLYLVTNGTVSISAVGFEPITDTTPISDLPGQFNSSNDLLTRIWKAGARTVQEVSNPIGSIRPNWLLQDDGALVPPQHASTYLNAVEWSNYTLSFEARITGSGMGWMVLAATTQGLQLELNRTHIALFAGYSTVNDTRPDASGLFSYPLIAAELPSDLRPFDGSLHTFATVLEGPRLSVSVDMEQLLDFSGPYPNITTGTGSFGFGGSLDHAAVYTNVVVTDTAGGDVLYTSNLTSTKDLEDFKVGTNHYDVILDGARRDRIVWVGDIAVTAPAIYYSTSDPKYISGSLELLASWQNSTGAFASDVPPTAPSGTSYDVRPPMFFYSLAYEIFALQTAHDYYMYTANLTVVEDLWYNIKAQADRLLQLQNDGHLIAIDNSTANLGMDWDWYDGPRFGAGTKLNSQAALALNTTAVLADALGQSELAAQYRSQSTAISQEINDRLWNATGGFYMNTDSVPGIAQDANAWAIIAGVADPARAESALTAMAKELKIEFGMLAFSADAGSRANISPFISGFHLEALMITDTRPDDVLYILGHTYGTMINPANVNNTGTFWEVMAPDGTPGLDIYTSLCHGWGAAPTALLSGYVLGVRPVTPGFAEWIVAPQPLNTTSANGRVQTPHGSINVSWDMSGDGMQISVDAPKGTNGTIYGLAPTGSATLDGEVVQVPLLDRSGRIGVAVGGGHHVLFAS